MKSTCYHLAAVMALLATVACSDPTGPPNLPDLAGSWKAVKFELTDPEDGEKADLIALGLECAMRITKQGGITFITRESNEAVADSASGTIVLHGDRVTIDVDGDTMDGTVTLVDTTLTFDFPSVEFFDGSVRMLMVFRRQ